MNTIEKPNKFKNSRTHTWTISELKQHGITFDLNGNPIQINEDDIKRLIEWEKKQLIKKIYEWMKFKVEVELSSDEILNLFEHDYLYV